MNVTRFPSVDWLRAISDFDEKLSYQESATTSSQAGHRFQAGGRGRPGCELAGSWSSSVAPQVLQVGAVRSHAPRRGRRPGRGPDESALGDQAGMVTCRVGWASWSGARA